jgi:1-acyl-sn-glycerol-3-phosphate acyltransferase
VSFLNTPPNQNIEETTTIPAASGQIVRTDPGRGWKHLRSRLRSYLVFDPLIWSYTVILGILSLLSSLFDRNGRVQHGFARLWSWLIMKTIFSPVTVSGLERIDTSRPHVYAVNHASAMDIPVLYVYLPFQFRIMAKKELFRYPFVGWHLKRSGQIRVDQQNPMASIGDIKSAVKTLKAGMPVVIFPEGGRTANGQLKPFLPGAFFLAVRAQVDIVPMALVGTYELLPMNTYHIKPRPLELVVGEPISTAGYSSRDLETLAERVKNAIADLYYSRAAIPDPRKA